MLRVLSVVTFDRFYRLACLGVAIVLTYGIFTLPKRLVIRHRVTLDQIESVRLDLSGSVDVDHSGYIWK